MRNPNFARVALLLLALVVVGAQLHFCADFTNGSHVCQLCATAGNAVVAQVLVSNFALAVSRLEAATIQKSFSSCCLSFISPRAPPAL